MKKKEDLRIRKTKANLYRSLLQLMENKTFEEIKVIDICSASMINRSTFYDHFNDKYELLASLIEDLKTELIEHIDVQIEANSIKEYYIELLKLLLEYFEKNLNVYSSIAIVKKNNNSIAFDMMFDASLEAVTKRLKENYINKSDIPIEVIALFYVSGVTKICTEAIKDTKEFSSDKIIKYLEKLLPEIDYLEPKNI